MNRQWALVLIVEMLSQGGQRRPRPWQDPQPMQLQSQSSSFSGMKPTQFMSWMKRQMPTKLAKIIKLAWLDQRQANPKDHRFANPRSTRKLTVQMPREKFTNLKTAWRVTTRKLYKRHLTKIWSWLAIRNLYRLLNRAKGSSMLS